MTAEFIDFPYKVEYTPQSSASIQVTQIIYRTANFKTKLNLLLHFLTHLEYSRVMIFARTKKTVINLTKFLERTHVGNVRAIHSNKAQNSRINALNEFRDGRIRLLISTDVSARGIDIHKVSQVINFDVPFIYEDYIHRIGRTGRAFETGEAITFVTPPDEYHIDRIESIIKEKISVRKLPEEVVVENTPKDEAQLMNKEIDRQKRRNDPTFLGAFHERKR
jgi:ATP-dependent RNA helicase RhlE